MKIDTIDVFIRICFSNVYSFEFGPRIFSILFDDETFHVAIGYVHMFTCISY